MTRFQENREKGVRLELDICAKVMKRLHKEKLVANRWLACWVGQTQFEVKNGLQGFTVDLATTHYSCRKWNIIGIPYAHAITCIFFNLHIFQQTRCRVVCSPLLPCLYIQSMLRANHNTNQWAEYVETKWCDPSSTPYQKKTTW